MLTKYSSPEIEFQERQLREYFGVTIPKLLEYINEHKITHILLLEKTARLFKAPLIRLFSELGMPIKIGSYTPDYFESGEGVFYRKNQNKKLNFLPDPGDKNANILILDDFSNSGLSLIKASNGLRTLGYDRSHIYTQAFSGFSEAFIDVEENDALNSALMNLGSIFHKDSIFRSDNPLLGRRHARINPNHPIPYKEIIRSLTRVILDSTDYYLAHPSQKPKTEIAEYIESQGFRVPKRYKNLEEALASGKDFIMRSEHPQDYDGVSGLFESYVFHASERKVTQEEVQNEQSEILALERVREYCEYTGKNYEEFIRQSSFEYWEYIEGENLTVVRDEVVEGRYHIFVNDKSGSDYVCYDSGSIIQGNIPDTVGIQNVEKLIEQYEKISHLPRFDELQCPNIEFQLGDDGNIYFLQYKRGHQKHLDNWVLDKELDEGEIEAQFVRGVTKEGGEVFEVKQYGVFPYLIPKEQLVKDDYKLVFNLKLPICIDIQTGKKTNLGFHGFVSEISQSGIYLDISYENFSSSPVVETWYKLRILDAIRSEVSKTDKAYFRNFSLKLRIYSDGKRAIVKILTSLEELVEAGITAGYAKEEIEQDSDISIKKAQHEYGA